MMSRFESFAWGVAVSIIVLFIGMFFPIVSVIPFFGFWIFLGIWYFYLRIRGIHLFHYLFGYLFLIIIIFLILGMVIVEIFLGDPNQWGVS